MRLPSSTSLVDSIRSKIAAEGPVSFAWFMEQVLYHPNHGYYSTGRAQLGRTGDYFTNVSVGSLFGRLVAVQLNEIWQQLGAPPVFSIVEQGAHNGDLGRDILRALSADWPQCYQAAQYQIVEPFAPLQQDQKHTLAQFSDRVRWFDSLDQLPRFVGVHFSNELLDAMPVHLIRAAHPEQRSNGSWLEKRVAWQDDRFNFVECAISDPELKQQVAALPSLPPGSELEVNLAALDWIDRVSQKLARGFLLTTDYGYVASQLHLEVAHPGTLHCRRRQQALSSPFDSPGDGDITAHINWTALGQRARSRGLDVAGFTDQHHFLTGIISTHPEQLDNADAAARRQLQTLLHPEIMGRAFQVLALARDVSPNAALTGFRFARPPMAELGLSS